MVAFNGKSLYEGLRRREESLKWRPVQNWRKGETWFMVNELDFVQSMLANKSFPEVRKATPVADLTLQLQSGFSQPAQQHAEVRPTGFPDNTEGTNPRVCLIPAKLNRMQKKKWMFLGGLTAVENMCIVKQTRAGESSDHLVIKSDGQDFARRFSYQFTLPTIPLAKCYSPL